MRRALLARPRAARHFRAGDVVAYWRDQKWSQGVLSRGGRWYGSGVVLGHLGKNIAVAHRTHIFRCAPEQVRLATTSEKALIESWKGALSVARSTLTWFHKLILQVNQVLRMLLIKKNRMHR